MEDTERHKEMAQALRHFENKMRSEAFDQTQRGLTYLELGFPKEYLLAALGISLRTWERRVAALRTRYEGDWRAPSRKFAEFEAIMTRGIRSE